ncbi:MAG TPA: 30S ribosomal protein S9, partial [Acetobacteraceae bacterium]|nr:30S ribosomal protein S9 [Acetobacteraceae bacterium]
MSGTFAELQGVAGNAPLAEPAPKREPKRDAQGRSYAT